MMRTLCFSFLVLASSQMVMSGEEPSMKGNLFDAWDWDGKNLVTTPMQQSHVPLPSAPFKYAFTCVTSFAAGVLVATGLSPLSPTLLLATVPSWCVGPYIINERMKELETLYYSKKTKTKTTNVTEIPGRINIIVKTMFLSWLLPIGIGSIGMALKLSLQ